MKSLIKDCVALSIISLLLYFVLFGPKVIPAPIPPAKPIIRPSLAGTWMAYWSGAEWPTVMIEGGGYVAERAGGPRYEGQWKLVGDDLTIEERCVGPNGAGHLYKYSFRLLPGKLFTKCGGLKLERIR